MAVCGARDLLKDDRKRSEKRAKNRGESSKKSINLLNRDLYDANFLQITRSMVFESAGDGLKERRENGVYLFSKLLIEEWNCFLVENFKFPA